MPERRRRRAKAWDLLWDSLDGLDQAEFFAQLIWRAFLRPSPERRRRHVIVIGDRRWQWATWRAQLVYPLTLESLILCAALLFWSFMAYHGEFGRWIIEAGQLPGPWSVVVAFIITMPLFLAPLVFVRGLLRRFETIGKLMTR